MIQVVDKFIALTQVQKLAQETFGVMVKGVVDLRTKVMALGGELHADAEAVLLEGGSRQTDLWGFNIYPDKDRKEWLEFSSLINIRPRQANLSMEVQDELVKKQMAAIVNSLIQ
ncbi:MAG: DUF5674 family protein [Parcubacteria group bacterium]